MNETPHTPRLGLSAQEVAAALGIARSFVYELDKTGELGPQAAKLGNRRIWSAEELAAWCRHGMPARGRWLEIWPSIRGQAQESAGIGLHGPGSGATKRSTVLCRGAS